MYIFEITEGGGGILYAIILNDVTVTEIRDFFNVLRQLRAELIFYEYLKRKDLMKE